MTLTIQITGTYLSFYLGRAYLIHSRDLYSFIVICMRMQGHAQVDLFRVPRWRAAAFLTRGSAMLREPAARFLFHVVGFP